MGGHRDKRNCEDGARILDSEFAIRLRHELLNPATLTSENNVPFRFVFDLHLLIQGICMYSSSIV